MGRRYSLRRVKKALLITPFGLYIRLQYLRRGQREIEIVAEKKDILFSLSIILELVNVKLQSMFMPSHTAQQHSSRFVKTYRM
jgi:hypothetical protein